MSNEVSMLEDTFMQVGVRHKSERKESSFYLAYYNLPAPC